jgi:iron complex outermembrane receptor protein
LDTELLVPQALEAFTVILPVTAETVKYTFMLGTVVVVLNTLHLNNSSLIPDTFYFVNNNRPIITTGFESDVRLRMDEFQFFIGYIYVDAQRKYNNEQPVVPLTPQHKINMDIIYEQENNFSVAGEVFYISSMFRDFDTKTKAYTTIGLIVQKHFKHFSVVANCKNLFDVRQTRYENIVIPPVNAPTFRQVYAPLDGRVFNVAIRIKI